ncbi:MAG: pantoate--beta-alanine ligase [Myxococcota bacterium]
MHLETEVEAFRSYCNDARRRGKRLGLVPTMGALHRGHLSLVDTARRAGAECIALSIFVNPTQFAAHEDLDRYPRDLDSDLRQCESSGVDLVFAPDAAQMYPKEVSASVRVDGVSLPLEGKFRPEHFQGVATVLTQFFCITGPCVAVFGRKDYQQWRVVESLVQALHLPVDIRSSPIVRASDGLALSSRNRFLSESERSKANALYKALEWANVAWSKGERSAKVLTEGVVSHLHPLDHVDYAEIADPQNLHTQRGVLESSPVVLIAGRVGKTRLIDNHVLGEQLP